MMGQLVAVQVSAVVRTSSRAEPTTARLFSMCSAGAGRSWRVERQRVWVLEELAELLLELLDRALGDVAARVRGGRLLGGIGSDNTLKRDTSGRDAMVVVVVQRSRRTIEICVGAAPDLFLLTAQSTASSRSPFLPYGIQFDFGAWNYRLKCLTASKCLS